ncbi:Type III secretion system, YscI/HrpB-like protein [Rhizobium sp. PDO1-076]|uniref:type III secretion system, YscI/HrpB-like protein n=1 Tax=Rhizobium sp. PDO1-076 TaxID=1125979 RepID=UPI00024E3CB1|nr:type III secretion system, YscI/HrpB-like protein [Rhizobium sp. PDO1-076]EHS51347.1 Type III secretion system, YscI/HrpB-like protein [Rhizobium sp. PDO1-076]
MATITALSLASGAADPTSRMRVFDHPGPQVNAPAATSSIAQFEAALNDAQVAQLVSRQDQPVQRVRADSDASNAAHSLPDQISPSKTYGQMDAAALAAENERAVQGIELGQKIRGVTAGKGAANNKGDMVLDGLSNLRSVFDEQIGRLHSASTGPINGTEKFFSVQVEMAKFTLLMDVASKLSGKATQTIDTLLKGQ